MERGMQEISIPKKSQALHFLRLGDPTPYDRKYSVDGYKP